MVGADRPRKRTRREDVTETFWGESTEQNGLYLKIELKSGKSFKGRGWPYIQTGVRGILGNCDKVEKANILRDGTLLVKTKNKTQTEKLLAAKDFLGEECEVKRDEKLNTSRGTIHAFDLIDLSEDEIGQWLEDFGVVGVKRFTKRVNERTENLPILLLTFDRPSCPVKLELDYVTYHVKQYIPNPLICMRCGTYGHPEDRCQKVKICMRCGENSHGGQCDVKCLHCKQIGHTCLSRECSVWKKEKEICKIKVEQEVSYAEARKRYEKVNQGPSFQSFTDVVRVPSEFRVQDMELKRKVDSLEKKVDELTDFIKQMFSQSRSAVNSKQDKEPSQTQPNVDGQGGTDLTCAGAEVSPDVPTVEDEGMTDVTVTDDKHEKEGEGWIRVKGRKEQNKTREKAVQNKRGQNDVSDMEYADSGPSPVIGKRHESKERPGRQTSASRRCWRDET